MTVTLHLDLDFRGIRGHSIFRIWEMRTSVCKLFGRVVLVKLFVKLV